MPMRPGRFVLIALMLTAVGVGALWLSVRYHFPEPNIIRYSGMPARG